MVDFCKEAERHIPSLYYSPVEAFEIGACWMRDEVAPEMQAIAEQLMQAHDNEDWQEVAHIALDVVPRLFKEYGG